MDAKFMKKIGGMKRDIYSLAKEAPNATSGHLTLLELKEEFDKVKDIAFLPCYECGKESSTVYFSEFGRFMLCKKHELKSK